jgi:hypothetical protein
MSRDELVEGLPGAVKTRVLVQPVMAWIGPGNGQA